MCRLVLEETALAHANAGALTATSSPPPAGQRSQGMMLESLNPDLDAHAGSPTRSRPGASPP
jgi:hypothetical protein